MAALPDSNFWADKRVLLTGHTGFKGSWAALWLKSLGAHVSGFALPPDTSPSLFDLAQLGGEFQEDIGNLTVQDDISDAVHRANPQIVIHMAAQSLVRRSLSEPIETIATNVLGTAHLLQALRDAPDIRAILIVTSDKVYANDDGGSIFSEQDPLGGKDPYSASKACAELITNAFDKSYFFEKDVVLATARAGNVIGGGDYAPDRIIPDIVRAISRGEAPVLRHPESVRPWQHVLDCLAGYFLYVEALAEGGDIPQALNFGPQPENFMTVGQLTGMILAAFNREQSWLHKAETGSIEARTLALDASLAHQKLGWQGRLSGGDAVAWTADWYQKVAAGGNPREITMRQISAYSKTRPEEVNFQGTLNVEP